MEKGLAREWHETIKEIMNKGKVEKKVTTSGCRMQWNEKMETLWTIEKIEISRVGGFQP